MSGDGDDPSGEAPTGETPSPRPPPAGGGGERDVELPLPPREGAGAKGLRALCRIDDIPDGDSKGFPPPPGGFTGLFAVRQGDAVHVYVNSCPHIGTPLDWMPDRFLSADGSLIICATHGAEFRIADGECVYGPCKGDRLEAVMIQINDGTVFVPEDAGL
jgi:nitrite reductase/ring-hydroxylating ferredoxin subunit